MKRREFITLIGGAAATWPFTARSQQAAKLHRIGYLHGGSAAANVGFIDDFKAGMRDLGEIEGQDFVLETRFADGHFDRLPSLAEELVALNPDVLFVVTTPANLAAKSVTSNIPIVMVGVADPIGAGLIANLARPGGNITRNN